MTLPSSASEGCASSASWTCGSKRPSGLDLLEPLAAEQVGERPVHERDALLELRLLVLLGRLERPLEVVQDREQVLDEPLRGAGGRQLLVARDPLAVVVELRREPAQVVQVLVALASAASAGLGGLHPRAAGLVVVDPGQSLVWTVLRALAVDSPCDCLVSFVLGHEEVFASSSITS